MKLMLDEGDQDDAGYEKKSIITESKIE